MCLVLCIVSLSELVYCGWWGVSWWTSLYCFVAILDLFSQSLSIVLWCGGQLLTITFRSLSVRCVQWSDFTLIKVSCHCVIDVMLLDCACCTRLIQAQFIVCSASFHLLLTEFDIPKLWQFEFEVSQFEGVSCLPKFLYGMTFPTLCLTLGKLDGFKGAVDCWLLPSVELFNSN